MSAPVASGTRPTRLLGRAARSPERSVPAGAVRRPPIRKWSRSVRRATIAGSIECARCVSESGGRGGNCSPSRSAPPGARSRSACRASRRSPSGTRLDGSRLRLVGMRTELGAGSPPTASARRPASGRAGHDHRPGSVRRRRRARGGADELRAGRQHRLAGAARVLGTTAATCTSCRPVRGARLVRQVARDRGTAGLPELVAEAFRQALTAPQGPVVLEIPSTCSTARRTCRRPGRSSPRRGSPRRIPPRSRRPGACSRRASGPSSGRAAACCAPAPRPPSGRSPSGSTRRR